MTQRHIPEDLNFRQHCCKNLKPGKLLHITIFLVTRITLNSAIKFVLWLLLFICIVGILQAFCACRWGKYDHLKQQELSAEWHKPGDLSLQWQCVTSDILFSTFILFWFYSVPLMFNLGAIVGIVYSYMAGWLVWNKLKKTMNEDPVL